MEHVIKAVIPAKYMDSNTIFHINPCGLFIYGGPMVMLKNLYMYCNVIY